MRIYGYYSPVRRGLTGFEFLPQYLDEHYPGVKFIDVISDNTLHFGYLESDDSDLLAKALYDVQGRFSFEKTEEVVVIGAVRALYNPPSEPMHPDMPVPTHADILNANNITPPSTDADWLNAVKEYKREMLVGVTRYMFTKDNDSISNVAKAAIILTLYNDSELTADQISKKNNLISRVKALYTPELCLDGFEEMITYMENVLAVYYAKKQQIVNATTVNDVLSVKL